MNGQVRVREPFLKKIHSVEGTYC